MSGVKGHARRITRAGKFNHTYKPRCACGWVAPATHSKRAAVLEHREHSQQVIRHYASWPAFLDQLNELRHAAGFAPATHSVKQVRTS